MRWHIALGTVSVILLTILFGWIAVNEPARMEAFTRAYQARQVESGAAIFENNCRTCHGPQGKGITGVAPALNAADLFNGERLAAIGFSGTVEDYLSGVISAGRPVPSEGSTYPQRMPTWGQAFGGPLREDQVESVVAFIMNWEDRALAEGEQAPAAAAAAVIGTDITQNLPPGDAQAGAQLAGSAEAGCTACHELSSVGPYWPAQGDEPGVGARAEARFRQADYSGAADSAEAYLLESIVLPNAYVVEGYGANIMPGDYGDRLTAQQVADLIAYLLELR